MLKCSTLLSRCGDKEVTRGLIQTWKLTWNWQHVYVTRCMSQNLVTERINMSINGFQLENYMFGPMSSLSFRPSGWNHTVLLPLLRVCGLCSECCDCPQEVIVPWIPFCPITGDSSLFFRVLRREWRRKTHRNHKLPCASHFSLITCQPCKSLGILKEYESTHSSMSNCLSDHDM